MGNCFQNKKSSASTSVPNQAPVPDPSPGDIPETSAPPLTKLAETAAPPMTKLPETSAPPKTMPPPVQPSSPGADDRTTHSKVTSPAETVEEYIRHLEKVNNMHDIDNLIDVIGSLLHTVDNKSKENKPLKRSAEPETVKSNAGSVWTSLLQRGAAFLEFVNKHIQVEMGDEGTRQAVAGILQNVGKVHWVVGGLAIVAFLLDQIGQVYENRTECIELLRQMFKLAGHIRQLKFDMPQEEKEFNDAMSLIVEGSMMCASQLNSKKLFRYSTHFTNHKFEANINFIERTCHADFSNSFDLRRSFFKASVNSRSLSSFQSKIYQLYQQITMRVVREIQHEQPTLLPPSQPLYPYYAVGIEEQQNQVTSLLDLGTKSDSPCAVVIYGYGGIGKTTLANAVTACLDLKDYNYTGVQIHEDPSPNDLKCIQQQILKDAFPVYTHGRNLTLRHCTEGQDHLAKAFETEGNKPVFIFIDNALRAEVLQQLLPKFLQSLPKRSRIVVTTRNKGVTDMLQQRGLQRREHLVDNLPDEEAKKILFKEAVNLDPEAYKDEVNKMLWICAGIPLVLEIAGAHLHKQQFRADKCTQIFEALEKGHEIKEENLSRRLVNFVYNELEQSTQEAFLDICCFFTHWNRRHVEHIVGAEDITFLEEAALVKTSDKNKLIVHDVIRAKGQSMSKSNRIMTAQSLPQVTQDQLKQIKGVWLTEEEFDYEFQEGHLVSMRNSLRVLALGNRIKISGQSQKTYKFEELRFLQIGDEIHTIPMKLKFLERLAVFHGPIFWDRVSLYQLPRTLRVMKATAQSHWCEPTRLQAFKPMETESNSSLEELDLKELKSMQKLPDDLHHLTALEILILDDWDKMEELPEQVCRLSSLRKLSICDGHSLKVLPEVFGQLISLKELKLTNCALEKLPSSFGKLKSLKDLNLGECSELKELPSSFGELSSLAVLNLESCWKLEGLPSSFGQLRNLKKLSLQSEYLKELPFNFGELSSLVELRCNYCGELKQLPESFGQLGCLANLDLTGCMKLKSLPSTLGQLTCLKDLSLLACYRLEALPSSIMELQSLKLLDLRHCRSLKKFPSFAHGQKFTIRLPEHLADQDPIMSKLQPPWNRNVVLDVIFFFLI